VKDWSDPSLRVVNEFGSKARIGTAKSAYSEWRRTIGHKCYATDIDWIEWRSINGQKVPVAVIDTTHYHHELADETYRINALTRFNRDSQGDMVRYVAAALYVPAYFVLVRLDCQEFHVCRLHTEEWRVMSEAVYRKWLMQLDGSTLGGVKC
jgi:hypothetical protein